MSTAVDLEERGRLARQKSTSVLERALGRGLLVSGIWFWTIIVVTSVVMTVVQSRAGGLDGGSLQYTLGSARWFTFTLGLILGMAMLPVHIASGGTRRSFVNGLVRVAGLGGLGFGLVAAVVLLAERLAWNALGWEWSSGQGLVPEGSFAVTVASEALVVATYFLAGSMFPAGYMRLGPWGGSFFILALLVLVVFVDWCVHTGYIFGWETLADPGPGRTLLGLGGALLATAVAALGVDRLYRSVPLAPAIT